MELPGPEDPGFRGGIDRVSQVLTTRGYVFGDLSRTEEKRGYINEAGEELDVNIPVRAVLPQT